MSDHVDYTIITIKVALLTSVLLLTAFTISDLETPEQTIAPEADFIAYQTSGCAPFEIQFFDQSTGDPTSWSWTFPGGDPATSTEQNPVVTFKQLDEFTISLEVSNADGSDQATKNDYITTTNIAPEPSFTFESGNNRTVILNNTTQFATDYVWEFGDGTFSQEENPTHSYSEDGTYIIKLKATNECGGALITDIFVVGCCDGPANYTANDQVKAYTGGFRPGTNLGYNPPWTDEQLADIAAGNPELGVPGAGCKSIRPALVEHFLEEYGYDIRYDAYQHYGDLKLKDNTVIIGFPSEAHRDPTFHCTDHQSEMFANLYTPIWDNGENGTPINDTNYLALYLYKTVNLYKENVKFWEVWNEPGFDYTNVTGWLGPGFDGNWWENDPTPCDYKLRAPIYDYIRTLRISYEVIKAIDPDAYVTLASVGFTSFLDAILRNTDNPNQGNVSPEYPLGGGAYFDAIAIHSYPHFDGTMRTFDPVNQEFVYNRHTDQGASAIEMTQDTFQSVLNEYGYDGNTFPKKEWIITEINIPRRQFQDFIGSDEAQVNFIMKAYIESVLHDIRQIHIYDMAESFEFDDAINEFQVMGLYKRLFETFPYNERINDMGVAYKTTSDMLFGSTYDPQRSAALQLPANVRGEAFLDKNGHYTYAMWAPTFEDMSENTSATFSFPASMNISQLIKTDWGFSYGRSSQENIVPNAIQLTATPIFLTDTLNTFPILPTADFVINETVGCRPMQVTFSDQSSTNTTGWTWSFPGGNPATSTEKNPTVTYNQAGTYSVTLIASNAQGQHEVSKQDIVVVDEQAPSAGFEISIFDNVVTCSNTSMGATNYFWEMGTGETRTESNPTIIYPIPGFYEITLIAYNGCGSDTIRESFIIRGDDLAPIPEFTSDAQIGCAPFTVQFFDESSENTTEWFWAFEGGEPNTSNQQNPVVTFKEPGVYFIKLVASNSGEMTAEVFKTAYITVDGDAPPEAHFSTNISGDLASFFNQSIGASSYLWDFGDGLTSREASPVHRYTQDGNYNVQLINYNACGTDTLLQTISIVTPPTARFSTDQNTGCIPFEVQFTNTSSSNSDEYFWTFPGGNPATSTEQNPLVSYQEVGQYDVQLKVENEAGENEITQALLIVAEKAPVAGFNYENTGNTVRFFLETTNAKSVEWDFGNGNTSSDFQAEFAFPNAGTYPVQLTVTNDCGTDQIEKNIEVVIDGFGADQTRICKGTQVSFTDYTSINATRWTWSFTGATPATSTLQNPTVSYSASGLYSVSLVAYAANDSVSFTQTNYIRVLDQPVIEYTYSSIDSTVYFYNNSTDAETYEWDFDGLGTSTERSPVFTFPGYGTYTIRLRSTNICDAAEVSQKIVVNGLPDVTIEADTLQGCAPLTVQYTDNTTGNISQRNWTFPGGNPSSSTEQNPVITYDNPGRYDVSLNVTNAAGSRQRNQSGLIAVFDDPIANYRWQPVNDSTFQFINESIDANQYIWYFADGTNSTAASPLKVYAQPGDYFVQLLAYNDCGTDTITQMVRITPDNILSALFAADQEEGCAPMEVQYQDFSKGSPTAWNWSFPGGNPANSTDRNPIIRYEQAGTYPATLIVENGANKDSLVLTNLIKIKDRPMAEFSVDTPFDNQVRLTNNSAEATSYLWQFGDGSESTLANPTHTYNESGDYLVQLIAFNECGQDTTSQTVSINLVSNRELEDLPTIQIFPNPADGLFNLIITSSAQQNLTYRLFDLLGNRIEDGILENNNGVIVHSLDFRAYAAGAYHLVVYDGVQYMSKQIVIVR